MCGGSLPLLGLSAYDGCSRESRRLRARNHVCPPFGAESRRRSCGSAPRGRRCMKVMSRRGSSDRAMAFGTETRFVRSICWPGPRNDTLRRPEDVFGHVGIDLLPGRPPPLLIRDEHCEPVDGVMNEWMKCCATDILGADPNHGRQLARRSWLTTSESARH